MCWKHSWKQFCEGLFSSSIAFIMSSVSSQKSHLFNSNFSWRNRSKLAAARSRECGWFSSVVTLFFAKKSSTKPDRRAGELSWKRKRLLVLHFLGRFLPIASPQRLMISIYVSLFTVAIPLNYTNEFLGVFETTKYEGWNFNSGNYLFTTDTK